MNLKRCPIENPKVRVRRDRDDSQRRKLFQERVAYSRTAPPLHPDQQKIWLRAPHYLRQLALVIRFSHHLNTRLLRKDGQHHFPKKARAVGHQYTHCLFHYYSERTFAERPDQKPSLV